MPKVFTSTKQKIGKLGEELAKRFLMKHGYTILEENYTKKYGEMDLIAQKNDKIHFVEVKSIISYNPSVSHETKEDVSCETYDPLQNMNCMKLRRLSRVIQVYLLSKSVTRVTDWQFDVITVKIKEKERIGTVKHLKNIII